MKRNVEQIRQCVVLGHELEVNLCEDDRWSVVVDGQELATQFGDSYDAWAVGVAESYRQGKIQYALPPHD